MRPKAEALGYLESKSKDNCKSKIRLQLQLQLQLQKQKQKQKQIRFFAALRMTSVECRAIALAG
jgi:hypothetical protein